MQSDHDDDESNSTTHAVVLLIHVVRTGGFAGMKREWTAEPPPDQAPHWQGLIEECPWDAAADSADVDVAATPARGADTFAWRISARLDDRPPRTAALRDDDLNGPWRQLIDEVRSYGTPVSPSRERPGR